MHVGRYIFLKVILLENKLLRTLVDLHGLARTLITEFDLFLLGLFPVFLSTCARFSSSVEYSSECKSRRLTANSQSFK